MTTAFCLCIFAWTHIHVDKAQQMQQFALAFWIDAIIRNSSYVIRTFSPKHFFKIAILNDSTKSLSKWWQIAKQMFKKETSSFGREYDLWSCIHVPRAQHRSSEFFSTRVYLGLLWNRLGATKLQKLKLNKILVKNVHVRCKVYLPTQFCILHSNDLSYRNCVKYYK